MKFEDIEKLIKLVASSGVAEVEVSFNRNEKIRVSKVAGSVAAASHVPAAPVSIDAFPKTHLTSETAAPADETKEDKGQLKTRPANIVAVKSPMVGTFYRAPAPDAPPYVDVGDAVKPGTVVCIVEAMKLMNEIESDVSGRIVEILVENETPVEYGQELFLIETS